MKRLKELKQEEAKLRKAIVSKSLTTFDRECLVNKRKEVQDEINNLEKDEMIEELQEGISDEIDNLREEIIKLKKRNKFLEDRDKDFQRVFDDDRAIFNKQSEEIDELKKKVSEFTSKAKKGEKDGKEM